MIVVIIVIKHSKLQSMSIGTLFGKLSRHFAFSVKGGQKHFKFHIFGFDHA